MNSTRFEYLVHEIKNSFFKMAPDIGKLSEELNRLGSQGWELVAPMNAHFKMPTTTLIFKRAR